jgi:hypothetical protein
MGADARSKPPGGKGGKGKGQGSAKIRAPCGQRQTRHHKKRCKQPTSTAIQGKSPARAA